MRQPKGDWTDLFRSFRMSLDPRKLWLALQGVVASVIFGWLLLVLVAGALYMLGAPFGVEANVCRSLAMGRLGPAVSGTADLLGAIYQRAAADLPVQLEKVAARTLSPVDAFLDSQGLLAATILSLLIGLVLLLVWSYFGGAIMRIAAVEYATGERIELASARAYAKRKHHSIYGAVLLLCGAIVVLGLAPLVGGLIAWNVLVVAIAAAGIAGAAVASAKVRESTRSLAAAVGACVVVLVVAGVVCILACRGGWRIPYIGELLLGILSPLLFLVGLAMVMIAIWCVGGGMLMAGTIASSDTDVFDAWSRSFHYVFTHPWRYLWHLLVMMAYGAVIVGFLWVVRVAVEWAVLAPIAFGLQGDFDTVYHFMTQRGSMETKELALAPRLLAFFLSMDRFLLHLIFFAFVVSFFGTAKTIVYFLMRRAADGTPITEVHLEPRDQEIIYPPPAPKES